MRIVHCIFSFTVGGAETLLADILNEQVKTDDVTLVIVNDRYDPALLATVDRRVKVVMYGRHEGSFPLPIFIRLNLALRAMAPDIIHLHDHKLLGLIRGLDRKIVFTVHHLGLVSGYIRKGVAVVAISDAVSDDIRHRYSQLSDVTVIPNGINLGAIRMREPKEAGRPFRIINVARLAHEVKGQHLLIEATKLLKARNYDVRVDFIGDGGSMDYLRGLAERLGLADEINFLGCRSRGYIYSHLADYDLMCHPSLNEGFGLTVAEGMAAMLPVAVSDEGGPFEVIGYGKWGFHFVTGDAESCADVIAGIIDDYSAASKSLDAARKYVADNYSLEAMVAEYKAAYTRRLSPK